MRIYEFLRPLRHAHLQFLSERAKPILALSQGLFDFLSFGDVEEDTHEPPGRPSSSYKKRPAVRTHVI